MCLGVIGDKVKSTDSYSVGWVMNWDGIRNSALLKNFQVILTQLIHKPHLEHQRCRAMVLKPRHALESHGGSVKIRIPVLYCQSFSFPMWRWRIGTSNKFPGDAATADLGHFEKH